MKSEQATLPHRLERTVVIGARPETVFRFFTDSARWAAWWGKGSTIEPRPGGRVRIVQPNGVEMAGEVLEIAPPQRLIFTYGYAAAGPIPAGGSRVTIRLEPVARGTRLVLAHEFAEAAIRDHHVQGWRYQLSLFANVVADEVHGRAAETVDAWFAAWSDPNDSTRGETLLRIAAPGVRFRDRFSFVEGMEDLMAQLAAVHRFMPGAGARREGEARHCQGTVLADWVATGPNGAPMGSSTNVFELDAEGRVESVVGIWKKPAGG